MKKQKQSTFAAQREKILAKSVEGCPHGRKLDMGHFELKRESTTTAGPQNIKQSQE